MKYVERHLAKIVERVSKQFPVVLVTGPRQVGKTTMLNIIGGLDKYTDGD